MSSNIAFRPQGGNIYTNRAPGSERKYLNANNAFMMPSTNIIPSAPRSRNNNGELNLAPGADRPFSAQRSLTDSSPYASEKSSPNSEPSFPIHYEQRAFIDLAPGSNRPSTIASFGQRSCNFNRNSYESKICDAYATGVFASSQCQDYNNSFYDRCVDLQRLRITCDHRIIKFSEDVRNVPDSLSIGSTQTRPMDPSALVDYQVVHMANQLLMSSIDKEERKTREKLNNELAQARTYTNAQIKKYTDMEKEVWDTISSAEITIKAYFQRNIELLERRQRELLNYLEAYKRKQSKALTGKIQNLNEYNLKITQLTDALKGIQNSNNLEEIKRNSNSITKEIKSLAYKMNNFTPINPLDILFQETDIITQHNIAALGGLYCKKPEYANHVPEIQDLCKKGRAILGTPYMIRVLEPSRPLCFGKGYVCRPWGVCCDKSGNIFVGDRSNHRITKFNPDGTFAGSIGSNGKESLQFNRPSGIAIDLLDRLIIADKDNHRVQIVTDGELVTSIGNGCNSGSEDGQFNYPWDVAVNMKGDIVVADSRNKRIQLFDLRGNFLGKFCFDNIFPVKKPKTEPTPRSVCFTPSGDILVADFHHLCVVAVSQDLKQHQLLKFEKQFSRPQGIACDDFGNIIIADSRDNEIKVFRKTGQHVFSVGKTGSGTGQLDRPNGLCLTPEGRIVCVDFGNNRLEMF